MIRNEIVTGHGMNRDDLKRSWRKTTKHLEAAKRQLPKNVADSQEGWSLQQYEDYLSHNELELAFDELDGLGSENQVGAGFWKELQAAAEIMELREKAARCKRRAEPS
jgi:hypothetical protein